mmetsp:Transcript_19171/g.16462  ORF Transcript_19171/g.16462 Transcript_19171/m.16462 type:complete len:250 (-) Transcript_19171:1212-1961(-)
MQITISCPHFLSMILSVLMVLKIKNFTFIIDELAYDPKTFASALSRLSSIKTIENLRIEFDLQPLDFQVELNPVFNKMKALRNLENLKLNCKPRFMFLRKGTMTPLLFKHKMDRHYALKNIEISLGAIEYPDNSLNLFCKEIGFSTRLQSLILEFHNSDINRNTFSERFAPIKQIKTLNKLHFLINSCRGANQDVFRGIGSIFSEINNLKEVEFAYTSCNDLMDDDVLWFVNTLHMLEITNLGLCFDSC